jgi:hypothetical protein
VDKRHYVAGAYLLFGAYCWYKWNQAGVSSSILNPVIWPYQLFVAGFPTPWNVAPTMVLSGTTPAAVTS